MEGFKKYLPYIIGAAVLLFILSRLRGGSTALIPQTQITQTPQPDPYSESRLEAFKSLVGLAGIETEANAALRGQLAGLSAGIERARIAGETEVSVANAFASAARREAELGFLSRDQDRQTQQAAIDRYYSSRRTSDIIGSINTALSGIFRPQGGIFTPPTFPRFGGIF